MTQAPGPPAGAGRRDRSERWWADPDALRRVVLAGAAAIWIVGAAYVATYLRAGRLPYFSDSLVFLSNARHPWLSLDLWAGIYPFGYPVAIKLFGEGAMLHLAQAGLAGLAWWWLAVEIAASVRNRWVAFVASTWVVGMSLAPEVAPHHQWVMTESLSMTAMVAVTALALRILRTRQWWLAWAGLPLLLEWIQLRKSNVVVLAAFVVVLAVVALVGRSRRAALGTLACLLIAAGSMSIGARTHQSGQTITKWVVDVVLPRPELRDFAADRGMPVDPAVLDLAGNAYSVSDRIALDPELADFREWLAEDASGTYSAWLLSNPGRLGIESVRSLGASISATDPTDAEATQLGLSVLSTDDSGEPLLPPLMPLGSVFWLRPHAAVVLWVAAAAAVGAVALRRSPRAWRQPMWAIGWFLVVTAVPHAVVSYFGDIVAQARHGLGASLQLRLGLVLVLAWAGDTILEARRRRASAPARVDQASCSEPDA